MSLAWTILLALIAGPGGHPMQPAPPRPCAASPPVASASCPAPCPSRSLSAGRRCWHRSGFPGGWPPAGLEEFDTEEVDEAWVAHLDMVATVPGSWLAVARSRDAASPEPPTAIPPPSRAPSPLRC